MRRATAFLRQRHEGAAGASRTTALLTPLARPLLIAVAAGLFMALVGAFGTSAKPLLNRAAYWVGVIAVGTLVGSGVGGVVRGRGWLEARPWAQAGLILAILTPVLTALVCAITWAAFGPGAGFAKPWGFFAPVLAVSAVMVAIGELAAREPLQTHGREPRDAPPRFLDRLPYKLRGSEIFAVEAQDHYLRLHTSAGSDLLLMRLSDAIAELEGIEGAQTHRSWWVARAAVEAARRTDGRAMLKLKGGLEAPVSRTFVAALRAQGWF